MTKIVLIACLFIVVGGLTLAAPELGRDFAPTALAQQNGQAPLYRYQSQRGHYLYATSAKLPAGLDDGPWESEGVTCYVPQPKPHGTTPVYQLSSQTNNLGTRYFFTVDLNEVQSYQTQGWINQGIVFHIADVKLPGTVPVYRLYKGLAPQVKKDKSLLDKISEAISGPEFTQETAGVLQDSYFYTIREEEKALALKSGFIQLGILGYAWPPTSSPSTALNKPEPPKIKTGGTTHTSIPLALNLIDVRDVKVSSGQLQGKLTAYDLAITNAKFPADAFQQLTILAPNPCAGKSSTARLQAEIIWGRQGKDSEPIMRGTCIPLGSPQDLAKMTFNLGSEKGTASLLQVIIHDRLTGIDHKSNVYPVGAFGIGKVLSTLGCKAFLGRPDDFLCSNSGMVACENLRKQGKPINCRAEK
jgi:hypothetical protein